MNDWIHALSEVLSRPDLVLSFSGIRCQMGLGPDVSPSIAALAEGAGYTAGCALLTSTGQQTRLVMGRDPRPTGAALGVALARGFRAAANRRGIRVGLLDLGVITTPLLQAAVRCHRAAGGVMITASHNPLTDNGFKFLHGDEPAGSLIAPEIATRLTEHLARLAVGTEPDLPELLRRANPEPGGLNPQEDGTDRIRAERAYLDELAAAWAIQPHCLKPLTLGPALVDPNGGAACGIAARVLEHFGVRTLEIGSESGYPEHCIDTDGIEPASGRHTLMRVARAALRAGARFGIAFDYDADRGNLVLPGLDESALLAPQQVATLNTALALAHAEAQARPGADPLAIVLSDATSGSVESAARAFGAETFMVETGEVNVVRRMVQLRRSGYRVPVGVEGANGGTVFGTATCRDGVQTALCAALADSGADWLRRSPLGEGGLAPIISRLPHHDTRAHKLRGPATAPAEAKERLGRAFADSLWPRLRAVYDRFESLHFEGLERLTEPQGEACGGWRIELFAQRERDFLFLRPSRTEAGVWRLIVDSPEADRAAALEAYALGWWQAAITGRKDATRARTPAGPTRA